MKLWPHQVEAVARLREGNYMLAWEPGVGKTLPALAASAHAAGPSLYLCPAPLRNQIGAVARARNPDRPVQVIQSGHDRLDRGAHLVVCSYEQAADVGRWIDLITVPWVNLILDEAHYCKNPTAQRTKAVYGARLNSKGALYRSAERVWPLTGTPILNDPTELWPHVSRLWPDVLDELDIRTADEWMRNFCRVHDTAWGPKILGGRNLPVLNRVLKPRMSRLTLAETQQDMPALTTDAINLPPVALDLSGVDTTAVATLEMILDQDEDWGAELGALEPHMATMRRLWGMAKVPALVDIIKTELHGGQQKMVVFFHHTDVGRLLAEGLGQFFPVVIDGSTKDKSWVVKKFANGTKHRVLLAQLVAGGTGLDGMQHATNRVLMAEYAWTPALNQQAIARVARAGQRLPVRASYCVLANSLDEKIARALSRKEKIVQEVLG